MKKIVFVFLFIVHASILVAQIPDSAAKSVNEPWTFSTTAYYYLIPNSQNILSLLGYADHKSLHLEARYNYEDLNTASVFAGWRLEAGKNVEFAATPMIGGIFGQTNGFAPGLELELSYKKFDFYSETEFVIVPENSENNYVYTWLELAITPFEHFRTGLSVQRTKLYKGEFDLQRGFLAEYSFWKMTTGVYYFDPFTSGNFLIFSLKMEF
jgi:hypothetical protein